MANRLAVNADRGDRARRKAGLRQHRAGRSGTAVHQRVGGERRTMDLVRA